MQNQICARFSQERNMVHVLDTKIADPIEREQSARVMPHLIWLVRKAAVIDTYDAAALFEQPSDVDRFTTYEQQSIVMYARAGRLDDLVGYPVTACDTRWDLVIPSTPEERQVYEQAYDPAYRSEEQSVLSHA